MFSDEALVRFQEKLDLSITKETLIFREIAVMKSFDS
jgi:hypothetical protein